MDGNLSSMLEHRIEELIHAQFGVSPTDPRFDREADLFEQGYVDSVGVVELLEFLQARTSTSKFPMTTSSLTTSRASRA